MSEKPKQKGKVWHQAEIAAAWWRDLTGNDRVPDQAPSKRKPDRGAVARLRRCSQPIEAAAEPACIDLYRRLLSTEKDPSKSASQRPSELNARLLERVAVIAILLAQLRSEPSDATSLTARLGRTKEGKIPKENEAPVFSAGRLRALIDAHNNKDVLRGFRSIIAILGRDSVSPTQLARYALFWLDPRYGERSKIEFLFAYHQAGSATPDAPPDTDEKDKAGNPA